MAEGPFGGIPIQTMTVWRCRWLRFRYPDRWWVQRGKRIYIFRWPPGVCDG